MTLLNDMVLSVSLLEIIRNENQLNSSLEQSSNSLFVGVILACDHYSSAVGRQEERKYSLV